MKATLTSVLIASGLLTFPLYKGGALAAETEPANSGQISVPITGRIFTDFYLPTADFFGKNLQQVSASLWLQADPKLSENSSGHFVFQLDQFAASSVSSRTGLQTRLREGFVDYSKSGFEIRAGQMIIPWGKSDVIQPTDFLSAKDYTFFNPDDEVRRLGAVSVWTSWTPNEGNSPFTFTFVGTPIFPQTRLLLAPGQVPSTVTVGSTQAPAATLTNAETAFKMAYSGQDWDASFLVFRGWNHMPDFQVTSITGSLPNVAIGVAQNFHPYRALGMDGSVTFGKWILRSEGAYVWTENDDGQNPLIQPSHLDWVMGLERPLGDHFRVQGQFFARYFPRYLAPSQISDSNPLLAFVYQEVARTNALIQNYQEAFRPSGTLRIAYSHDQTGVEAEIFTMVNFVGWDYVVRPKASYLWTDSLKISLGMDYYGGPLDRPFGALTGYNALFSEMKYSF